MPAALIEEDRIEQIVAQHRGRPAALLSVLQDIQDEIHWLPQEVLVKVARMLDVPLTQVYRVATFYRALRLEPRGEHVIQVCMGTACRLRGAPGIVDAIRRHIGLEPGKITKDMKFSLETVNCLGACALAPVVTIDGSYHGQMTPQKIIEVIDSYYEGKRPEE